jgi:hypothetical protein
VRRSYERAGFRVISHGYRGHMWKGTDTDFLDNQLAELRRHRRVVSNRLGSALFYGASVGCEIGVYGDPMILEAERAVLGGMARQKRLWPELHQPVVPRDVATELARVELGLDQTLSSVELIDVLGWRHSRRAAGGAAMRPISTEGYLADAEPQNRRAARRNRLAKLKPDDAPRTAQDNDDDPI